MLRQSTAAEGKPGLVQKVKAFIQETRVELGKVTWPTVDDLKVSTKVTMILLAIMSGVIFVYDRVFGVVVMALLSLAA
jgi:preprotein translocase subunit SecE